MTYHDALQTTFTSQYYYGLWRPVTAIRRTDEDANPGTTADPNWDSLLGAAGTPPHPSYASNASSASASAATIYALFYGRDDIAFQISFGGAPNETRSYASYSAMTDEAARSRVYGGVHFPFGNRRRTSRRAQRGKLCVLELSETAPLNSVMRD